MTAIATWLVMPRAARLLQKLALRPRPQTLTARITVTTAPTTPSQTTSPARMKVAILGLM